MATLWFAPPIVGRRVHLVAAGMGLQSVLVGSLVVADLALDSAYGPLTVGRNLLLLAVALLLVPVTAMLGIRLAAGRPAAYRPAIYVELTSLVISVLLARSGSLAAPGLFVLASALLAGLFRPGLRRELRILPAGDAEPTTRMVTGPWRPRRARRVRR